MNQSLQRWHRDYCLGTAGLDAIALEILKLLKLPVVMKLGEFWCLVTSRQPWQLSSSVAISIALNLLQLLPVTHTPSNSDVHQSPASHILQPLVKAALLGGTKRLVRFSLMP